MLDNTIACHNESRVSALIYLCFQKEGVSKNLQALLQMQKKISKIDK